jgi:hypothetical protein
MHGPTCFFRANLTPRSRKPRHEPSFARLHMSFAPNAAEDRAAPPMNFGAPRGHTALNTMHITPY